VLNTSYVITILARTHYRLSTRRAGRSGATQQVASLSQLCLTLVTQTWTLRGPAAHAPEPGPRLSMAAYRRHALPTSPGLLEVSPPPARDPRVSGIVTTFRDIHRAHGAGAALHYLAFPDSLDRLPNRTLFWTRRLSMTRAKALARPVCDFSGPGNSGLLTIAWEHALVLSTAGALTDRNQGSYWSEDTPGPAHGRRVRAPSSR